MNDNPYASPPVINETPVVVPSTNIEPATQGLRFVNFVIDRIVTQTLSFGVGLVLGIVVSLLQTDPSKGIPQDQMTALNVLAWVLGILTVVAYYVVTESLMQRTLGKLCTGTKVVNEEGGVPTFGQIVGRSFARLIPFEPFSCLSAKPVGWHDSLSKTRVVKA